MNCYSIVIGLVILYLYHLVSSQKITTEKFSSNSNDARLVFIADDILHIYHDKQSRGGLWPVCSWAKKRADCKGANTRHVGTARCCNRIVNIVIPDFQSGDRVVFLYKNTGGPGYFAGHILWKGVYYPTNNVDYNCTGVYSRHQLVPGRNIRPSGRRIGCYKDGPSRRLRFYAGVRSNESCREIALRRKHRYYAMQYGGECRTDVNLRRALSYGKLPDSRCAMRGRQNSRVRWTQRQGGGWANDIYDTHAAPRVRMCGRAMTRYSAARKHIHKDAMIIKSEQGPDCRHSELGNWVEFEWKATGSAMESTKLCPDSKYTEFNPAGCSDPETTAQCIQTVKPGFVYDKDSCVNILNLSSYNYDNPDFFSMIYDAWENNTRRIPNHKSVKKLEYYMKELMKIACMLESTNNQNDDSLKCIKRMNRNIHNEEFYKLVTMGATLCNNPKVGNPGLCASFKSQLEETIKHARIVNSVGNDT